VYDEYMEEKISPVPPEVNEIPKAKFPWLILVAMVLVAGLSVTATVFILKGYRLPFLPSKNLPVTEEKILPSPTETFTNTEGWNTYTDKEAGFSFRYPPTVVLEDQDKDGTRPLVHVTAEKIADIPETLPQRMGQDEAVLLRQSLTNGPEGTTKIGSFFGQTETTFSAFEICSVFFSRRLTFFPGEYRVMISVSGPVERIQKEMPEFFKVDEKNCGTQVMWDRDVPIDFLTIVSEGKGRGVGQEWYDAFDAILKTIELSVPVVTPTSQVTGPMSQTEACDVTDSSFCTVIGDIKNFLTTKNYSGFLSYQTLTSITCDPESLFTIVCDGAAKGTVRQGYTIGYNESEGSIVPKDQYVATITNYIQTNGPFRYQGSLVSGDKGVAVFLNPKKDKLLTFPMKRAGATWRMRYVLIGGDYGGAYGSLSQQILENIQ
jgi:hypothetical protein